MTYSLLTLTVPVHGNDGARYDASEFVRIESALLSRFGGFSRVDVVGSWQNDDGIRFDDSSRRYDILTDDEFGADWIVGYAGSLARILLQECILVTSAPVSRVVFAS